MITSALIAKCRQDYGDINRSMQVRRLGDGASTLYNLGYAPVIESSYNIYVNSALNVESTDYTLDLDSADLQFNIAQIGRAHV